MPWVWCACEIIHSSTNLEVKVTFNLIAVGYKRTCRLTVEADCHLQPYQNGKGGKLVQEEDINPLNVKFWTIVNDETRNGLMASTPSMRRNGGKGESRTQSGRLTSTHLAPKEHGSRMKQPSLVICHLSL